MACQSYSIRWSTSSSTVCSGGGTSNTWSVNKAGTNPAVGEFFAGNATCSTSISVGNTTIYVKIDGVPTLASVLYTVDGTNTANNGKILSIGTCPSPTPSVTPSISITPTKTPSASISATPSITVSMSVSLTPSITPSITPSQLPICNGNVVWQTIGNLSAVSAQPLTGDTYIFTTGQTYTISQTIPAGVYLAGIVDGIELPQYYTCLDCTTTTNPPYYNVYYNHNQGITTFNFSPPIENPLLAFYSLGSSSTNQTFSADTTFARYPYCNPVMPTCGSANPTEAIYDFSLNTISGYEAFGSVFFPGTHSSISIQALGSEFRSNFLWGKSCDYELVLEEPGTGYIDITYSSCTDGSIYRFQYISANTLNYSGLTIHSGPYEDCYYRATPPFTIVTQVDMLPGLYDYEYNTDCSTCTLPSPTPSVTPSLTPPPVTPSISTTPSISVSKTPSISISATPSISISNTPSVTPSITPSISISATPSISISKTPSISISKTPSVTPSITPSISVSNTPGVSTTPSISISKTPSISISNTPSISITPSITPSISISQTPSISISATPSISITPSTSITPSITPSITSVPVTPTPSPSEEGFDIYSFQTCCSGLSPDKFRYNYVSGTLIVGQVFEITGGSGYNGCAEVIPYEVTGPIYYGSGVIFTEQENCEDCTTGYPCPSPTPTPSPTISSCDCIDYTITNPNFTTVLLTYVDCYQTVQNISVLGYETLNLCACEGSLVYEGGDLFVTNTGICNGPSPSPQPSPSTTPAPTVTPSSGWNLCSEDFCLYSFDPVISLYNGNYTVAGFHDTRNYFQGDVIGFIYYNSINEIWCLADTVGGTCIFSGPTPSTSVCPDLWDIVFTSGSCNTTTTTTSPCNIFDFTAYFDCDVPSPTPTISITPTPPITPSITPSVSSCIGVGGSITISGYTTTTTTIGPSPSPSAIVRNVVVSGTTTFSNEMIVVCPGDTYMFININTEEVFYVEPNSSFVGVILSTGFTYSMTINSVTSCYNYLGINNTSPNGVVTGTITTYPGEYECNFPT